MPSEPLENVAALARERYDEIISATHWDDGATDAFRNLVEAWEADRLRTVKATLEEVARCYERWDEAIVDPTQFVRALDVEQMLTAITRGKPDADR